MELIERIVSIILPVFAVIGMGYGYARWRGEVVRMDMASVNRVSMEVLAPLMVFSALSSKSFDLYHNGWLILASVLISLGSGLLAWPLARALGYDKRTFLPPMMYNNGGNMGLPLLVLAFGPDALPAAVALFTAATFVYFSLCVKMIQSGREQRPGSLLRLLSSPIMLAMILGILCAVFRVGLPGPLFSAMKLLGEASIPIMLFSLGVRMMDISFKSWRIGLIGAVVCPLSGLICALLLDQLLPLTAVQRGEMYLFASLRRPCCASWWPSNTARSRTKSPPLSSWATWRRSCSCLSDSGWDCQTVKYRGRHGKCLDLAVVFRNIDGRPPLYK